jgi:peptide chain release factor
MSPKDGKDAKDEEASLFLSAGRGPQECAWALAHLVRRLEADAGRHDLVARPTDTVAGPHAGTYRSAVVRVTGTGAQAFAASWTGTLCWQAPSPYRPSAGRKNWYVIAQPYRPDAAPTRFAEEDVDIVGCRTGGPGGQHRNKVSTAVRATHRPTGIVVVVDTERQFGQNRRLALERLRERIERGNDAADRAVTAARWRAHDELVRGNPVRTERPA